MRPGLLLIAAALLTGSVFATPAHAASWCAVLNLGDLSENCHFQTRKQCQASLTGNSDFCRPYAGRGRHSETNGSGSAIRR
jgi:hypothetical protein